MNSNDIPHRNDDCLQLFYILSIKHLEHSTLPRQVCAIRSPTSVLPAALWLKSYSLSAACTGHYLHLLLWTFSQPVNYHPGGVATMHLVHDTCACAHIDPALWTPLLLFDCCRLADTSAPPPRNTEQLALIHVPYKPSLARQTLMKCGLPKCCQRRRFDGSLVRGLRIMLSSPAVVWQNGILPAVSKDTAINWRGLTAAHSPWGRYFPLYYNRYYWRSICKWCYKTMATNYTAGEALNTKWSRAIASRFS